VISGEVAISTFSKSGQVLRLNTHVPGEVTGEIALLDGGPRTATATMSQPGTLFVLNRAPLLALLESEPRLAIRFIELICERIRWTSHLLEESAFLTVPERLASRLLWLSRTSGVESAEGVRVRISQSGLAQWLNVSRQVVNGYLQEWQSEGYLSLARGAVLILEVQAMEGIR
jgi:CRP-like cAMP-binding protein